jgi:hypothetical protein
MGRLASFAFATVVGWGDWVCSDSGWEVCPGHRGSAGTSDKLWAGCRCYGWKREIAFVGRHQVDSLAEAVERCAPPLAAEFVGGRDPCRRKVGKTPWANASGECIRRPGTTGKHEVADLTGPRGVKVGRKPRRAVSPAERRPERPTPGQKRLRNSTTQAGICSRSGACRSWCICHWWYACNHCSGSIKSKVRTKVPVVMWCLVDCSNTFLLRQYRQAIDVLCLGADCCWEGGGGGGGPIP